MRKKQSAAANRMSTQCRARAKRTGRVDVETVARVPQRKNRKTEYGSERLRQSREQRLHGRGRGVLDLKKKKSQEKRRGPWGEGGKWGFWGLGGCVGVGGAEKKKTQSQQRSCAGGEIYQGRRHEQKCSLEKIAQRGDRLFEGAIVKVRGELTKDRQSYEEKQRSSRQKINNKESGGGASEISVSLNRSHRHRGSDFYRGKKRGRGKSFQWGRSYRSLVRGKEKSGELKGCKE